MHRCEFGEFCPFVYIDQPKETAALRRDASPAVRLVLDRLEEIESLVYELVNHVPGVLESGHKVASDSLASARLLQLEKQREAAAYEEKKASSDLGELGLHARVLNTLTRAGVFSQAELVEMTDEELLKIRNLGRKSAFAIRAALEGQR